MKTNLDLLRFYASDGQNPYELRNYDWVFALKTNTIGPNSLYLNPMFWSRTEKDDGNRITHYIASKFDMPEDQLISFRQLLGIGISYRPTANIVMIDTDTVYEYGVNVSEVVGSKIIFACKRIGKVNYEGGSTGFFN